jgi:hypothetical protein
MLLVDITIGSDTYYLSNDYIDRPEQFYDAKVLSFSDVSISVNKVHGGYAGLNFGSIVFIPNVFKDHWPPPVSIDIKAYFSETKNSEKLLMFDGKLHRNYLQIDGIGYTLYGKGDDSKVTDKTYSGTLIEIFSDTCSDMGLTLNSTKATNPSADINYTAYGEKLEIINLSDIAATFGHCFYIAEDTLYLIDMDKDNGTESLSEFDFFPSRYVDGQFYSLYRGLSNDKNTDTEYSVSGAWDYGREYRIQPFCRNTPSESVAVAEITKLKNIFERPRVELKMPITNKYTIGQKISFVDESKYKPLNVWFRIRSITWNFNSDEMVLQGEGEITA